MTWQQGSYCNLCGKELDIFDIQEDFSIKKHNIGYGSVHDGDAVDIRLCCGCFDRLVKQCTIDPITEKEEPLG